MFHNGRLVRLILVRLVCVSTQYASKEYYITKFEEKKHSYYRLIEFLSIFSQYITIITIH
jgi:hypothetical protein